MTSYDQTIIDLFEQQVKINPEHIAISDGVSRLSYKELMGKANQFASYLHEKSVREGDVVALFFDPCIEFIVCVLAIIKIGAIYLPLDVQAPEQRIEDILVDAGAKLVITNKPRFNFNNVKTYQVEEILTVLENHQEEFIEVKNLNNPIAIFYTSGSTGNPKGVIIGHKAVVNLVKVVNYANIKELDIIAQFSSLAFDASTFEIWSALLNGAALFIITASVRKDYIQLREVLSRNTVNCIFLPTAFFHQIINAAPNTLDVLETIVFGGEQVNTKLLTKFLSYRKKNNRSVKLINGYGPTEATTFTCRKIIDEKSTLDTGQLASIGSSIENVKLYVLDENLKKIFAGQAGELYISGINLALGYHNAKEQNKEKFIKNPFDKAGPFKIMYKTGDKVKQLPSGELLYIGRVDDQVKISGFRIHLNEIESQLIKHPLINSAAVAVEKGGGAHNILAAYLMFISPEKTVNAEEIRDFLAKALPAYMLPVKYLKIDKMPLNSVGKVDKKKLKDTIYTDLSQAAKISINSLTATEKKLKTIFADLLNRDVIDANRNLFELGANSLIITEACVRINKEIDCSLQISDLLTYTSIHKLALYLDGGIEVVNSEKKDLSSFDIAIVGMACRFPEANTLMEFWDNLCKGKECLTDFGKNTKPSGLKTFESKKFIPIKGVINDIEKFDASFFNFNPIDASITDPQKRIFLECVWEALEHSGNIPSKDTPKLYSVYAGMADSHYLYNNLRGSHWYNQNYDWLQTRITNSFGMLSTQVSYKLNLHGKSLNINTACSTGLVAVEQACQDLMLGNSDVAIVGGVSIDTSQRNGYFYQPEGIESADGRCKPFSKDASGTVFSDGVGIVILKRLNNAVRDNDAIYAVIKGCGTNNDGSEKVGFTAPSTQGQINCITNALLQAGVSPESIGYVEAHGTATSLGDLVEFKALTEAYKKYTDKINYCALGSVKSNIGHTDIASGMAGLIKTALSLYFKKIPPTLHFSEPNPGINIEESPFFINTDLLNWEMNNGKRYAGVSAFGIGGTNAHVVLEEYIQDDTQQGLLENQLILLSGKSKKALEQNTKKLVEYLSENKSLDTPNYLADIAYTLKVGRDDFPYRAMAIASNFKEAISGLTKYQPVFCSPDHKKVVFMFAGQGTQYPQMALQLFETIPYFSALVTECSNIAKPYLDGKSILSIIKNSEGKDLNQTKYTQIALFIIEYALAKLLIYFGVIPSAFIGHSIGEYVAACLADMLSLEEVIKIICERGLLMSQAPIGEMLAIDCTLEDFSAFKQRLDVSLALHNATHNCVASGSIESINKLEKILKDKSINYQKIKVGHAFHSNLMDDVSQKFEKCFENISLSDPKIPLVSNVTGKWLEPGEAIEPQYWGKHLRQTVLFKEGVDTLLKDQFSCFVEVGLGHSLSAFVKEIVPNDLKENVCITHVLPNYRKTTSDEYQLLKAIGILWLNGVKINWPAFYTEEKRRHVALPTYSFQREYYWVEPDDEVKVCDSKVNKSPRLYEINREDFQATKDRLSPKNEVEEKLIELWQDVLGLKNIGVDDNFFDLGGDSIKAVGLVEKINKIFKCKLVLLDVHVEKTISELARKIYEESEKKNLIQYASQTNGSNVLSKATIEQKLLELWQKFLGIKNISVKDDFFDLGGHSLKALSLIKIINEEFKSNISLQDIYKYKSISGLASIISEQVNL